MFQQFVLQPSEAPTPKQLLNDKKQKEMMKKEKMKKELERKNEPKKRKKEASKKNSKESLKPNDLPFDLEEALAGNAREGIEGGAKLLNNSLPSGFRLQRKRKDYTTVKLLYNLFAGVDTNNTKTISEKELEMLLTKLNIETDPLLLPAKASLLMAEFGKDKELGLSEIFKLILTVTPESIETFAACVILLTNPEIKKDINNPEYLKDINEFDKDDNKKISHEELRLLLKELNIPTSKTFPIMDELGKKGVLDLSQMLLLILTLKPESIKTFNAFVKQME